MTHIVSPTRYPSKKAFKEAVLKDPTRVYVDDPSMFNPVSGNVQEVAEKAPRNHFAVTNHPKRSWFAAVSLVNGKVKVS